MRRFLAAILLLLPAAAFGQASFAVPTYTAGALGAVTQVATPTFSPVAGTYSSTQTVTISTATVGAVLCYTTDGSTPTESGNLCSGGTTATYSTPITVSTTKTVKALGTLATYTDSAVGTALYTINACSLPFTDTFPGSSGAALSSCWTTYVGGSNVAPVLTGSGGVKTSSYFQFAAAVMQGGTTGNNQTITVTYAASNTVNAAGPLIRANASTGVWYLWDIMSTEVQVNRYSGGTYQVHVITNCPAPSVGDVVSLSASGTTITCTDVTKGTNSSGTDSNISSGYGGIQVIGNGVLSDAQITSP